MWTGITKSTKESKKLSKFCGGPNNIYKMNSLIIDHVACRSSEIMHLALSVHLCVCSFACLPALSWLNRLTFDLDFW